MSSKNTSVFPDTLEQERPETGFQDTTDKGGIGERQAAEGVTSFLESEHGNADLLTGDKHVNDSGPDFAVSYTDAETGLESQVVGDNKDMGNPVNSSWDSSTEAVDDYQAQGLDMIAETDRPEPLLSNDVRSPTNVEPSYTFDEEAVSFYGDNVAEDTAAQQMTQWDYTEQEVAAEFRAEQDTGNLSYLATTTDEPLKEPSIEKLSEQGIEYTHIETPTETVNNETSESWLEAPDGDVSLTDSSSEYFATSSDDYSVDVSSDGSSWSAETNVSDYNNGVDTNTDWSSSVDTSVDTSIDTGSIDSGGFDGNGL